MENNNFDQINYDAYFNNDLDKKAARKSYRTVIFSYLLYFLSYSFAISLLYNKISYPGIFNSTVVIFGLLIVFLVLNNFTNNKILDFNKNHLGISKIIFFLGLMYMMTFVFNFITNFLMNTFNISSVDVTATLQSNINLDLFIYVVLIGPFAEELQYRGFYLNTTKKYGAYASIILTTIIFSFAHLNFIQGVGTLGIGLVLGYVAYFYSFRSAVILHILNNFIVMLLGFLGGGRSQAAIEENFGIILFSLIFIGLMINSIIVLLKRDTREKIKENLKIDVKEKFYLKTLFSDPIFYIFVLILTLLIIKF